MSARYARVTISQARWLTPAPRHGEGAGVGGGDVGAGGELEQAQVVVVGRVRGPQEGGPPGHVHAQVETEHVAVEADRTGQVADVEDGVVEAADGHGGLSFRDRTSID